MDTKERFSKLYKRFLKKFYLKIALFSLLISLTILLVLSLSFWIIGTKLYWIAFVVFGVALIASFVTLCIVKKPTEKEFYSSIEELGLAQRAITMYQFREDDSLMAKIQRENAKVNIESKDYKLLKITAPLALIITVAVILVLSIGTSIASGLSANRIIPSVSQAINNRVDNNEVKEYEITFEVEGDGSIEGEIIQFVKEGEDALGVTAVAEEGWYFYSWGIYDDHYDKIITDDNDEDPEAHNPYKEVKGVKENITYYAVFKEVPELDEEQVSDDTSDSKKPSKPQDGDSQQANGQSDGEGGGEGGGKYEDYNQVIDGSTYYGDTTFDNAYNDAMEQMQGEGDNTSEEMKKIISDYYENIEK